MDINEFVSRQLANPGNRVPAYLIIPGYIQSAIKSTKARSEANVQEMGNCLNWNAGRLALANETIIGTFDRLNLNLPIASNTATFIGTYHNHPYEKRYGADYALGPSSGDWVGWNRHFPAVQPLSVNIVTSGKLVFVAFLLQRSPVDPVSDYGDIDNFRVVRGEHIVDDQHRSVVYGEAIQNRVWNVEQQFYKDILRDQQVDLPRTHQEDVMRMNTSYASRNPGFALYVGALAGAVCKVEIFAHHTGLSFLDPIQSADRNACYSCGQRRTNKNPSYFSQWHRCPKCKAVFCPQHGKILPGNHFYSRARNCAVCDTRTMLF